jgi:hypothetical protein
MRYACCLCGACVVRRRVHWWRSVAPSVASKQVLHLDAADLQDVAAAQLLFSDALATT